MKIKTNNELRVAMYSRMASPDMGVEGAQIDSLAKFCSEHNVTYTELYLEQGISGKTPFNQRPAARKLLERAAAGHINCLLVSTIDRLGRNHTVLWEAIDELKSLGVDIKAANEPFDTSTPEGQLLLSFATILPNSPYRLLVPSTDIYNMD